MTSTHPDEQEQDMSDLLERYTPQDIVERAMAWAGGQDAPRRAAVYALAQSQGGHWFRDRAFLESGVREDPVTGEVFVLFSDVRTALDEGRIVGSSGELAMLRFAVGLALDEHDWNSLDSANRTIVLNAIDTALFSGRKGA